MSNERLKALSAIVGCITLGACGLANPQISETWDADYPGDPATLTPPVSATAQIEFEIKKRIYCELKAAVYKANHFPVMESDSVGGKQNVKMKSLIPSDWSAQVALSLQVDETTSLSPGVTFNKVLEDAVTTFGVQTVTTSQSFNLGLGGTLKSTATRIDKFNPEYSVAFLSKAPTSADYICDPKRPENDPFRRIGWVPPSSSPFLIESDLGIEKWLLGAMFVNNLLPSDVLPKKDGSNKTDSVSYEIKFEIVSSGNITPTWKLVRVSANTDGPLFGTGRTRTHDLIITLGPKTNETNNAHLAAQIGSAVGSANRALLSRP
ncbi:hypothetical protein JQ631_32120 [Bradyrhizobium manausense]|uniref:hypothetical protein n=1 Tax=Bradyrhizobium manausense TaxID=989370 RepID=UPI001BA6AA2C|nr:hypothetical protein [Bradyrhizobium manausense]MBR0793752.1 hypothetical protein [Bradyrhizobium manausense]